MPETKQCPDCAEEVLAAARKCRFCGYPFDTGSRIYSSPRTSGWGIGVFAFAIILFFAALGGQGGNRNGSSPGLSTGPATIKTTGSQISDDLQRHRQPVPAAGEFIHVPSDPRATYRLLEWRTLPNGNRESLSRRDGPSGTYYTVREIDCGAMQFRYLGEGETISEARRNRADDTMGPLTPESISTYVSEFVCSK
ncbi:MAG: zinc ribbon domain-containing protein [Sphingosinicella sp.]